VLGDNIDTDMIYPGRYLNITDREKTAEHLFELAYPELRASLETGDIIVAGRNFGCGSSREQAAAALKFAGVGAVIAGSFARIFFRNAINLGLPAVVAPQAGLACTAGDELEIDLVAGEIRNVSPWQGGIAPPAQEACSTGASIGHELSPESRVVEAAALDPRAVELIAAGGLIPYLKRKYAA
jgi:3-isopropylmalate dehydratase small subunit